MVVSIPAQAGDENGEVVTTSGREALERALELGLAGDSGQAALLLIEGPDIDAAAVAAAKMIRRADVLATLSPGRLALMAPHLREVAGAADLAARILAVLPPDRSHPAAVGVAVAPEDGVSLDPLIRMAEAALGRARAYSRGRFAFADAERDARLRMGPLLAGAIAEALAGDEFSLVYQPIVRLEDGAWVGAEALLRWTRPGGEEWSPALFIPEAERRGLMEPITAWTLEAACRAAAAIAPGAQDFRVGVNLSATMLGYGAGDLVRAVLRQTKADPARIYIEITETAPFIEDPKAVADVDAIAELGCGVAVDDFGAGHASLAYVVKLPASRIKLDGGLVREMLVDGRARAAVAATVGLAADIGADVVAEGIADMELAEALRREGVGLGQGSLFGLGAPSLSAP